MRAALLWLNLGFDMAWNPSFASFIYVGDSAPILDPIVVTNVFFAGAKISGPDPWVARVPGAACQLPFP
jgi:hypothetical protein